jgi:hypothetical protein
VKTVVDHIRRTDLPWRSNALTECGRPVDDCTTVITRAEAVTRWNELGAQRASFTLCMTCKDTANRWPTWDDSPAGAMARECAGYDYRWGRGDKPAIDHDLRAAAILIEAHGDEFNEILAGVRDTTGLAAARANRRRTNRGQR